MSKSKSSEIKELTWAGIVARQNTPSFVIGNFTDTKLSVVSAFEKYFENSSVSEFVKHIESSRRREKILLDFCGDRVSEEAKMATQLWSIIQNINWNNYEQQNHINSHRALNEFVTVETGSNWTESDLDDSESIDLIRESRAGYVSELLLNKLVMTEFWQEKFQELYPNDRQDQNLDKAAKILHDKKNVNAIDPKVWLTDPKTIKNHELGEFTETIQIESIPIYGTYILDILIQSLKAVKEDTTKRTDDHEIFRQCIIAESFLAPLCKHVGLHCLSSAILRTSGEIRLTAGGQSKLLEESKKTIDGLGSPEQLEDLLWDVVSELGGDITKFEDVIINEQDYGLFAREIEFIDENGESVRAIMRLKTDASLAKKMYRHKDANIKFDDIRDPIAFTFITDQDDPDTGDESTKNNPQKVNKFEQLELVCSHLIQTVKDSVNFKLMPTLRRRHLGELGGIHVRGTDEFITQMTNSIKPILGKDTYGIDIDNNRSKKDSDFHVVRVTGQYRDASIEIQCQTQLQRQAANLNHSDYKLGKEAEDFGTLPHIKARISSMKKPSLYEKTDIPRLNTFLRFALSPPGAKLLGMFATRSANEDDLC